jgi:hypothetical protein
MLGALRSGAGGNLQTFDSGDVLLSVTDPKTHDKWELHVDNDDLAGEEDTLQLSLHAFHEGQEIETPMQFLSQLAVGMKRQQNIWRLHQITVTASLPVGDPQFFKKLNNSQGDGFTGVKVGAPTSDAGGLRERPKLDIQTTLSMLGFLEQSYASQYPDTGFTCSLADLKSAADEGSSFGVDPQVFTGNFRGYRFSLTGCQGTPAGSYQIVAEPAAGAASGKAFCTDATHNIRVADDGNGSTCLLAGKAPSRDSQTHTEILIRK